MKFLDWLAWAEAMRSFDFKDDEVYKAEQEKAIRKFARVIEDCGDEEIKCSSIQGIVSSLVLMGRKDEARKYAELYPENKAVSKDDLIAQCLSGKEKIKHKQNMLEKSLHKFMNNLLDSDSPFVCDAIENILKIIFPDGNYFHYHHFLKEVYQKKAKYFVKKAEYDKAVQALIKAHFHVCEYDKIDYIGNNDIYKHTSPLFDRIVINTNEFVKTGTQTFEDGFFEYLSNDPIWAPLKERDDFKLLIKNNPHTILRI